VRRALIVAGVLVIGYAVAGIRTAHPVGLLVFLAAVLLAHDFALMPVVVGVGVLIGRFVPVGERATVRAAALCSLAVTVVAVPLVLGYGRAADNPSALPQDYGYGLATVLGASWLAALSTMAVRRLRSRRR
jgi:hypothetical protein